MLKNPQQADADMLAAAYVQLMDDLAFARSQFPDGKSTQYLNMMAGKIHGIVARNRRLRWNSIVAFFSVDVPLAMYQVRMHLLVAAVVFVLGSVVGFIGAVYDEGILRNILGNGYVDMTIYNIKSGHTLNVYADSDGLSMFMYIFLNNVVILLRSVGLSILPVVGAAYLLLPNAVMVGAFHGLFARYDQLATATLGIWIHGALELSAIVVAGGAAIRVTQAVVLPGTYPRKEAFIMGVRTAVMIAIAMVPVIFVAALLESFVTRYYAFSIFLNIAVIGVSLAFVAWYVVVLPTIVHKRRSERISE